MCQVLNNKFMYPDLDIPDVNIYPGFTTGIDLRVEMDKILRSYGHWVMVRHYDTTRHSKYWDERAHEAVGGPAWEYMDYIVRSRKVLQRSIGTLSALEMPAPPGMMTVPYVNYYVQWDPTGDDLTIYDDIYEFRWSSNIRPTTNDLNNRYIGRYNIKEAVDLLGDAGRREYYLCICQYMALG